MSKDASVPTFTAFAGVRLIASGPLEATLVRVRKHLDAHADDPVLVFEDRTGRQIDFDLRGSPEDVVRRLASHPMFATPEPEAARGPGRPKLGVVSREVSLLPRHWEWLERQPNGASAALRKLVDDARKANEGRDAARSALEAAAKFMWGIGGDLPDFEEASRALFAGDRARFDALAKRWPKDVRKHLGRLLDEAERLAPAAS